MKRIVLTFSVAFMLVIISCKEKATNKISATNVEAAADRDAASKNLPVMTFEKSEHDFGSIVQGTPQETIFNFTNRSPYCFGFLYLGIPFPFNRSVFSMSIPSGMVIFTE